MTEQINVVDVEETQKEEQNYEIKEFDKWDEIPELNPNILRGIYAYGFENPSAIQKKSILTFMDNKDLIAQAQSGTGKTGSFAIGVLHKIDVTENVTQAMILSPTRELTKQIYGVISNLGKFIKELKIQCLIGGTDLEEEHGTRKRRMGGRQKKTQKPGRQVGSRKYGKTIGGKAGGSGGGGLAGGGTFGAMEK